MDRKLRFVSFLLIGFSIFITTFANGESNISLLPKVQVGIPQHYQIYQIAIDGERMVVGVCDRYPSRSGKGVVYIFILDGNDWKKTHTVQLDHDSSQTFGCSVAISGDVLVVGEVEFAKKNGEGAVHVFRLQNDGWTKGSTIPFPRSSNHWLTGFGEAVVIHNGDIIVPANVYWPGLLSGRKTAGEVYIFGKTGKNWKLKQTLMPFENRDTNGFGKSVVLSNELLAIGAARNVQSGVVYLFQKRGTNWVALDSLSPPQAKAFNFGEKIAASDNYLVSSSYNEPVYIYKRQPEGFSYDSVIVPSDKNDKYSRSLVCNGLIAISGINKVSNKETYFVDLFESRNDSWVRQARVVSQLDDSKSIRPGGCAKGSLLMADELGNIYTMDGSLK